MWKSTLGAQPLVKVHRTTWSFAKAEPESAPDKNPLKLLQHIELLSDYQFKSHLCNRLWSDGSRGRKNRLNGSRAISDSKCVNARSLPNVNSIVSGPPGSHFCDRDWNNDNVSSGNLVTAGMRYVRDVTNVSGSGRSSPCSPMIPAKFADRIVGLDDCSR